MSDNKKLTKNGKVLVSMRSVDTVIRDESDLSFLSALQKDNINVEIAEKANLANNAAMLAVKKATK